MAKLAIPATSAEMQEMMDDPKVAAQIIQNGQWTEFNRAYAKATDERGEMADLVRQSVEAAMAGTNAIEDKVGTIVEDKLAAIVKDFGVTRPQRIAPDAPTNGAKANASYNPSAMGVKIDEIGFPGGLGDFARVAFNKGRHGDTRQSQLIEVMNAYSSGDASLGGFLIPEQVRSDIMELTLEMSVVRPRASVQTLTGSMVMPYVDQTTHVGSVFGGMTFTWIGESEAMTPSEAKFGRARYEANKLVGFARIPNELWADAPALSSWMMNALPRGISFFEDLAFLVGNGVGQPLGVQNSLAKVEVAKETNQAAATIVTENILKMYARCLPQSLGNSVWLANPTTFPQLMTLSVAVGTGGTTVNLVDVKASPQMTLLGRPLILTEKVPAVGTVGDIGLYDFSFYTIGDRQAVSLESSEHSRFANDETEVRTILRVDGRPWIQSALTPVNGDTLSPFVLLATRA